MAPFACLAILPVSRTKGRPPTSTVTECGAGMLVFSDIDDFLWLRVCAERSCEDFCPRFSWKRDEGVFCEAEKIRQLHHNKLRPIRDGRATIPRAATPPPLD